MTGVLLNDGRGWQMRRVSGFTLVEILIALTLTAIIAGIAVSAYRGYLETAELGVLRQRVDALVMFQENYRIDNGTYFEGEYVSGGVNDFVDIGYRVTDDDDGISMLVANCASGDISECFSVTATTRSGQVLRWDNGRYLE
jgi:type IV pilus assembly protein PilE